jgi:adenosylcobinamide-phosphate synthase
VVTRRPRRPLAAALGILLDAVVPEPPNSVHPVALFGRLMDGFERLAWRDDRRAGVAHATTGTALGVAAGVVISSTAVATSFSVARRGLVCSAVELRDALGAGDLERARILLPQLVGRDPSALDEKEMVRAVVESVAENTVDALVAPALWGAIAGAPGALGYRAVNTLDSMVGHRSARYARYGWASARLDDLVAWVPARLTALLVGLMQPRQGRAVWTAVRTQASAHPSPNAGVAEAAFAAALGLALGGPNRYGDAVELRPILGSGRPAEVADIDRAVRLLNDVAVALTVLFATVGLAGRR